MNKNTKMQRLPVIVFFLFCFFTGYAGPPGSFTITGNGIIVYPDPVVTGSLQTVQLEPLADHIIRVLVTPSGSAARDKSLVVVYQKDPALQWTVDSTRETATLRTKKLAVVVELRSGRVRFYDAGGNLLLSEKQVSGRRIEPKIFEGQRSYGFTQSFQTTADDAWYGLGQHQDGVFNYRGAQVNLFQNNTEVAVPFLVSVKNYGILWDNYSLTSIGDIRPYRALHTLRLFSKKGEEGWLTATYFNDSKNPTKILMQRPESEIAMEFINESKQKLPKEFTPQTGMVSWEGSLGSDFEGKHKFRFTYGGYLKVWVDGKLVLDRWRRAWNPAPALMEMVMEKGRRVPVRMEWLPDGGESYLTLKWQEPPSAEDLDVFSFSSEAGQQLDYYFIHGGNMDEVISGYRELTGKAPIVPNWALGFWQSRERYKTQNELLSVVAEFRKRKIPLDNIVLDWFYWKENQWGSQEFDPERFPSPDSMINTLHRKYKTQIMISVWPKFYEGISSYQAFQQKGWLYQRNIADRQKDWVGPGYVSTFYDAFNEAARKAFWDLIYRKIYTKGIDAWWMDASEPDILSNVSPQRRKQQMTPLAAGLVAEYLNAYPLQNAKGIYEGQRSVDSNKRVFLLTRSGFAGSQRYAAAIWSGDIGARWHDMKAQIPAGINFSMSGIPYWTMDIGGFVVETRFEKPNAKDLEEWRELNTRWYQFGAFVPLFRAHGQFPFREIFHIAPEHHKAYQSILYYNKLRYRLLPYIYSLAGKTYHGNYTIMRGLVMDFPRDKKVHSIGDQYLFGPAFLVNPVYEQGATQRTVYLPASTGWYDFYTGKFEEGGRTIQAAAPYERMPLFVKAGAIIPIGPELQFVNEKKPDTVLLLVYEGNDGSFTLYEDEGLNYNYEKGLYSMIPIDYSDKDKTLTIGNRQGQFPGMLQERTFIIQFIKKDGTVKPDLDGRAGRMWRYDGRSQTLSLQ